MTAFVISFFSLYGLLHLYVLVRAKSALALGEAYRHGRNDDLAKTWYDQASDLSGRAGHVDCLLWSLLGLSDCAFLQDDLALATEILNRLGSFVQTETHTHPLESLHIRLSLLAIATVRKEAPEPEIKALLPITRLWASSGRLSISRPSRNQE